MCKSNVERLSEPRIRVVKLVLGENAKHENHLTAGLIDESKVRSYLAFISFGAGADGD